MQTEVTLKLTPAEAADDTVIQQYIAKSIGKDTSDISGFYRLKQSIDARSRQQVWINLGVKAFVNEPFHQRPVMPVIFKDVSNAKVKVVVVGAGPAGLFAALKLIEQGIQPVVLERGKDVRARRRDLAMLNKEGIVDPAKVTRSALQNAVSVAVMILTTECLVAEAPKKEDKSPAGIAVCCQRSTIDQHL